MTNKEILEKAIQKAIDGGWEQLLNYKVMWFRNYIPSHYYIKLQVNDDGMVSSMEFETNTVIFNHDFAKALWGDKQLIYSHKLPVINNSWQKVKNYEHHLQQMVIAEDPIKYLGDNI